MECIVFKSNQSYFLAEKSRTNKWLSEQLGKDSAIVSKGGAIPHNLMWKCLFR